MPDKASRTSSGISYHELTRIRIFMYSPCSPPMLLLGMRPFLSLKSFRARTLVKEARTQESDRVPIFLRESHIGERHAVL